MRTEIRQAAVLDVDAAIESDHVVAWQIDAIEEVDHSADGGALRGLQRGAFLVAGQGEEVAIGTPAPAQRTGKILQRSESVARAQQDLGRTQRSGRENDDLSDDLALAAATAPDVEIVHAPRSVGPFPDVRDHRVRLDLGAVAPRVLEI